LAKGVRNFVLDVPNGDLYRIVRNLDDKAKPFLEERTLELVNYSPDEVVEDVEDVRLVTMGTKEGIKTTHNFNPRGDGKTEVMVELEAGLLKGGSTTVNINLAMWTLAYMAIESAYLLSKKA
jgi:hypothetical protein